MCELNLDLSRARNGNVIASALYTFGEKKNERSAFMRYMVYIDDKKVERESLQTHGSAAYSFSSFFYSSLELDDIATLRRAFVLFPTSSFECIHVCSINNEIDTFSE